jgi:hypothetical protein
MPQGRPGFQFVVTNGLDDGQALRDQVDDAGVDFIQPVSKLFEFIGGQGR